MQRMRVDAPKAAQADVCALAMCLSHCVGDVERHSVRSAAILRAAIAELGHTAPAPQAPPLLFAVQRDVLVTYLEYLLPEIDARSHAAALRVRQAVAALRRAVSPVQPLAAAAN